MNEISIKTIIIDDHEVCIKTLHNDLMDFPEIQVVETITSASIAKEQIIKHQPPLIFLDIEMPGMTGFELLEEIQPIVHSGTQIVFYSFFEKYMIDALRASAFDFLLKPYTKDELSIVIKRVKEKLKQRKGNINTPMPSFLLEDPKFALQTLTELLFLCKKEIVYFQYCRDTGHWEVILTNLSTYKLQKSTTHKEILAINFSFSQISKDCILNIDYLSSIENKTGQCLLYPPFNSFNFCISRRYLSAIKNKMNII